MKHTPTWRDHVSAQFLADANARLSRSAQNLNGTRQLARDVRGECYAIELRHNRSRQRHHIAFRNALDIAPSRNVLGWAQLLCEQMSRIAMDAEQRVRQWL